jgi:hypothetical protein
MFHVPGISSILGSPLQLKFHIPSCRHCPLRGLCRDPDQSLPGLPGLPLKSWWKPHDLLYNRSPEIILPI